MKKKNKKLICQDCGTDNNVRETTCPYAEEISNREVQIIVCDDCYRERVWDI